MKIPPYPRLLPFLVAGVFSGLAAAAAPTAPTAPPSSTDVAVQLDPFLVSTEAQGEYGVSSLAGATRLNTPIREIPQSVSVLTKDFLNAIGAVNFQDAAIWVSGVSPRPNVPDGTVIRSFLTTRTYNDGIRNFNGNYQSDLATVERIEIIKGPGAALLGTTEAGGIVNRVSKLPLATPEDSVKFQTGSFDFYRTDIDSTGPINADKSVLYRAVFAYQNNNTNIPGQSQERTVFAPSLSFKPYENTSLLLQYEYQDIHDPWNFGQPFYAVGLGGTAAAPKQAEFIFSRHLYQGATFSGINNLVQNMRATLNQKISPVWHARVVANVFRGDVQGARVVMGGALIDPANGDYMESQTYGGVTHYIKTFNTQADLVAIYNLGRIHNSTLFGAEYIWNSDTESDFATAAPGATASYPKRAVGSMPYLDLDHPNNTIYPDQPIGSTVMGDGIITQTGNQLAQTNQEGFFVQQQSKLFDDRFVLTGGMRYDRAWITTHNYLKATFTRTTPQQEAWVNAPRVGATFAITRDISAYAIWSQQQSPASQNREFPNSTTDFTILTTKSLAKLKEVGFKGEMAGGRLTASICYFDQNQTGFFQSTVTSTGVTENIIVAGALCRGLEFDTVYMPTDKLSIVSSYTHNFQYVFSATGVPTAVVPKDKVTTFLNYRLTRKWSINGGAIYLGPQLSVNGAQIYKWGGQTIANVGTAFNFNKAWSASLLVQNVTDKYFVNALVSTTSNSVAPDRNWRLAVTRRW